MEAPVRSSVIRRTSNGRRGRGRSNLTWEKFVKRDLKDWSIIKELALDRRVKASNSCVRILSSVPSLLLSLSVFLFAPFHFFCLSVLLHFPFLFGFFITFRFPSFFTLVLSLFFSSCGYL
jgi:hypothetical protein